MTIVVEMIDVKETYMLSTTGLNSLTLDLIEFVTVVSAVGFVLCWRFPAK